MQISRRILFACVATTILLPIFSQALDTAAQIKARKALEQAMGQPDTAPAAQSPIGQPSSPAAQPVRPAVVPPAAPAAAAPQRPVVKSISEANAEKAREALRKKMSELEKQAAPEQTAVPPVSSPVPTAAPVIAAPKVAPVISAPQTSQANIEKAREALRQKMNELEQQPAPAQPATSQAPATVPPATVTATPSEGAYFQPVPQTSGADVEKAREALHQKLNELAPAQPAVATPANQQPEQPIITKTKAKETIKPAAQAKPVVEKASASEKTVEKPKPTAKSKLSQAWQPLPAPPTGLSPEKEQQLKLLLDDYKADRLTPEQYHEARAKILAAP